jgi:methionyl aminopeptidase
VRLSRRARAIELKTAGELDAMRAAGLVVARTLARLAGSAHAGVSTKKLDEIAESSIAEAGAIPSFKGYHGFPGSICTSVNEQIVHGIPSEDAVLGDGDLVSVDCGAILDGWHGDAAITILIGSPSAADEELSAATRAAMTSGIDAAKVGARLTDISHAIEASARESERSSSASYGIVRQYGGHGIGRAMHMEPFVPNHGRPGRGPKLRVGMAIAIEPMLTAGTEKTVEADDGWTVSTADSSRAAHWEHTVAVTDAGPVVLTAPEA